MRAARSLVAICLLLALLAAQGATAMDLPPSPQELQGSYDTATRVTALSWQAPDGPKPPEGSPQDAPWVYQVYRDERLLGSTSDLRWQDAGLPAGEGYIYFVTATPDGSRNSLPAIVAVPTISCEVVNVGTSWDYPYVHVHLHEECLGGAVHDKYVTWAAPQ